MVAIHPCEYKDIATPQNLVAMLYYSVMKIFIVSPNTDTQFNKEQLEKLHQAGDITFIKEIKPLEEVTELFAGDEPRILAIDPDYCEWKVPNEVIDAMPNLQAVCLQTTSFSWVDVEHCKQKGIPVTNLRGFSSIAVAEWATMAVLALARRLPIVIKDNWQLDYVKHRGFELRGKTAGIFGLGRIGTAMAENLAGLGMNVQYWSKNSRDDRFTNVSLEELMSSSDVILPGIANNADTKNILTDEMVKSIKPSAVFMNVIHPMNHELLLEMVKSGKLYGYGYEEEGKLQFGYHEGNVWNGPALGWCTEESMTKNAQQWVESIVKAAAAEFPTQVNE